MGRFVTGDIVIVQFPFSDLKGQKLRPALVVANVEFDNLILCQITSKSYTSNLAIRITQTDFALGKLPIASYVRPDKLFTCDPSIIEKTTGKLSDQVLQEILQAVQKLFVPSKSS